MKLLLRLYTTFIFFWFVNCFLSQGIEFRFSDNIQVSKEYKPHSCFQYEENYVLIQKKIKSSSCDLKVNLFNSSLKIKNQFDAVINDHLFISINYFFDKIFLFTSKNENNSTQLYFHEFNLNDGFIKSKKIFDEPNVNGYTSKYTISDSTFDGSFFVLVELPYQPKKNEDIKLLSFDNSFKITDQVYNKLDIPFEPKRDNRLLISPLGKIILVKTFWDKGNNFYLYELGKSVIDEVEIKLNNRKIADIDYLFNKKNELVIAGFFTSLKRYNYEGYFIHKYDEDLTLVHKNQYFLSKKIVETFKSSNQIKETGFGLDKFRLSNFGIDQNGNYFLLTEHLGRKKVKGINNWDSKGMVAIKFNKNGNFIWACPITFKQFNEEIRFIGSFHLNSFNEAEYFYNCLSNLRFRKGVPEEYGLNNYCGTQQLSFNTVGEIEDNILKVDFPNHSSIKYSFYPKQLNPVHSNISIFSMIDDSGGNMIIGVNR